MAVRVLSLMMGIWLILSAFLWPHHGPVALTTWVPGIAMSVVALVALVVDRVRLLNVLVGLWVIAAAIATGADDLFWSDGMAGLTAIVAAFVPSLPRGERRELSGRAA